MTRTLTYNGVTSWCTIDGMRVEISDERFNLLPGYSGAECEFVRAKGGLDCPVEWPVQSPSALAGEQVRLRST